MNCRIYADEYKERIWIRPKMVAEFTPSFLRRERLLSVSSFILFASFVMSMFWFPSPCIMTTCLLENNSWFKRNMEKMSMSAAIISRCVFLDHAACANKRVSASSWFDFNSGNALASSFWIRYVWLSLKHPLAMIVFPGGISCFASRSFLPMKRTNFLLSLRFARNPLQAPPGYHE